MYDTTGLNDGERFVSRFPMSCHLFYQKNICYGYSVFLNFVVKAQFWAIFLPDPDKPHTRLEQTFPYPQRDGAPHRR